VSARAEWRGRVRRRRLSAVGGQSRSDAAAPTPLASLFPPPPHARLHPLRPDDMARMFGPGWDGVGDANDNVPPPLAPAPLVAPSPHPAIPQALPSDEVIDLPYGVAARPRTLRDIPPEFRRAFPAVDVFNTLQATEGERGPAPFDPTSVPSHDPLHPSIPPPPSVHSTLVSRMPSPCVSSRTPHFLSRPPRERGRRCCSTSLCCAC